jgi:hypothetical protein
VPAAQPHLEEIAATDISVLDPADNVFDRFKTGTIYLHDLIMGAGADEEAVPSNGDGLDCRKSNLRIRKKQKKDTS